MSVPAEVHPAFDALLREPLGDSVSLRKRVAAFAADVKVRAGRDELDIDTAAPDRVAETLELMLKRVSRKTTPLHHRLIHATARLCTLGPDDGRPLDDARFGVDVAVVNETARVIRRPELTIRL